MAVRGNLKEYVYNSILEDIFSLRFKPGDILNERAMVERYACSKSPVREALLILCNENVLRSIPRYGYEVVPLTPQDIRQMMELRMVLELGFLRRGIGSITDAQIAELEEINKKCMQEDADGRTHWEFNMEFPQRLLDFWGNAYASDTLRRCLLRQKRMYAQAYWGQERTTPFSVDTRYHGKIIEALKARDLDAALEAFRLDYHDYGGPEAFTFS